MTLKGLKKLLKKPHIFVKDYIKKTKSEEEQKEILHKLIKLNLPSDKLYFFLSKEVSKKKKNTVLEKELLEKAYLVSKKSEYLYKIASILKAKKQWWQSAEAFSKVLELSTKSPKSWYKEYAEVLTQLNRHKEASQAWKKAIVGSKNANYWFLYAYSLELSNQNEYAETAYKKAIEYDKDYNSKELGIGIFHEKRGHWISASEAYKKKLLEDPLNANVHYKLGLSLDRCYKWAEAENSYTAALALKPENIDWYYRLGFVRERQEKFEEAAESYKIAAENRKNHAPYWYYRLGYVLNKSKRYKESCDAFLMMKKIVLESMDEIFLKSKLSSKIRYRGSNYTTEYLKNEFLQFLLDESKSNSKQSVIRYLKDNFNKNDEDIELWKLFFDENNYKEKVFNYIKKEVEKAEKELEKAKKEAEKAKKEVEKLSVEVTLLEQIISNDTTRVKEWHYLAKNYIKLNEYDKAIEALKNLIDRKEDFDGNIYFDLGHMLAIKKLYKEASEAFIEQRVLQKAYGVPQDPYYKNEKLQKTINYTEYYERYEIEDKTILYESYHGRSISCNPYAIFKYVYEDENFQDYTHIWVINDNNKIPDELKKYKNIIFVKRESDRYMRYLAKAKYLINNSTFPDYYIRKETQEYVNTWHGTPIKHMGKDIRNDFMSHKNVTRNFLQASILLQPNEYTTDILLTRHDVDGIYNGVISEAGYPRQDFMINISNKEKDTIYKILKIDKSKKVVLYAPTWRGTFGDADFDTTQLENDIKEIHKVENTQILFRGHYAIEKTFDTLNLNITVVPDSIDTNTLLSVVDILITDYSSICFDFMALSRPILYYVYDKEEYEKERGLYFPIEELGGTICTNIDKLKKALIDTIDNDNISETQRKAQEKFCSYDDGKATKRAVDLIFHNKTKINKSTVDNEKKSILIYGGDFNPNGINTSFINLLNHIDTSKYKVSIAIDPNTVKSLEKRLEQFSRLHKDIKVIGRVGPMPMKLEERWIKNKFDSQRTLTNDEQWNLYSTLFQREFKRMFGYGKFDYVVEFNGYGVFWPSLFAFQKNNVIYQHNDMHGEWTLRFPALENLFRLYPYYNTLVSVSEHTMEHNINNLCEPFNLTSELFTYCDNVQNPKDTLEKAKNPLEKISDEKIFKNTKVFINIARLSPEKDQEKLIRAFKKVSLIHPDARLINLGSGALEVHLTSIIKELKLDKKVFLLGQRFNPYPYLNKSDCFVLSSNHEGQPMTLFEALILKKPIIATDIVGNRSVLEGRPGLLVENSEDGLYNGMLDFLEGRYKDDKKFDHEEYNQNALNMFYEKVLKKEE